MIDTVATSAQQIVQSPVGIGIGAAGVGGMIRLIWPVVREALLIAPKMKAKSVDQQHHECPVHHESMQRITEKLDAIKDSVDKLERHLDKETAEIYPRLRGLEKDSERHAANIENIVSRIDKVEARIGEFSK